MTASVVALCGCGHAERMHERDEGTDNGRGVCMHGACGCSEYRPQDAVRVAAAVVTPRIEAVSTDPLRALPYACAEPDCRERFARPQALGAHKRYRHPINSSAKLAATNQAAPSGPIEQPEPADEVPTVDATVPAGIAGAERSRFTIHAHVELASTTNGRTGGWIDLQITNATHAEAREFLALVLLDDFMKHHLTEGAPA